MERLELVMTQHAVTRMETSPFYGKAFPCTQVCDVTSRSTQALTETSLEPFVSSLDPLPGLLTAFVHYLPMKEKPDHSIGVGEQNKLRYRAIIIASPCFRPIR
jgi:hypothetical protein